MVVECAMPASSAGFHCISYSAIARRSRGDSFDFGERARSGPQSECWMVVFRVVVVDIVAAD